MRVGQQSSSSVLSVNGVGEGGKGSVCVDHQLSLFVVSGVPGDGMELVKGGREVCMYTSIGQQSCVVSVNGVGEGGEGSECGSPVVICGVRSLSGWGWSW